MAKTALELTTEEWQAFHPAEGSSRLREQEGAEVAERRQHAWHVARQAAALLRREFGASRVVVFGSLSHRAWRAQVALNPLPPPRKVRTVTFANGATALIGDDG